VNNIPDLFEKQAHWQKARKDLSWPEKIRVVEKALKSIRQLQASFSKSQAKPPSS